jgi:predicted transcriptional regulator
MEEYKLGIVESRFADIIWNNEPMSSRELVERCQQELEWKKSTTYTVLKKLCDRGIFRNQNGQVTSVVSRSEYYSLQSERFVEETFDGSLPAFLAAFTKRKNLTEVEIAQIRAMIDGFGEG